MKIFISFMIFQFTLVSMALSYDVNLKPAGGGQKYSFSVSDEKKSVRKSVYLVGAENPQPKRIVYIFHGYKPANDSYQQDPA
jgi:hypothetical protein